MDREYLTLKEASKLTGYASDYIGWLIRRGKIKGKKIYNASWITNEDAIKYYCVRKDRKKSLAQILFYFFKNNFNFSLGIPIYSLIPTILGFLIFSGLVTFAFTPKNPIQTAGIYPTQTEGNWQNSDNALGTPDVLSDGNIDSFSETNSAVYKNGTLNIVIQNFQQTEIEQLQETTSTEIQATSTETENTENNEQATTTNEEIAGELENTETTTTEEFSTTTNQENQEIIKEEATSTPESPPEIKIINPETETTDANNETTTTEAEEPISFLGSVRNNISKGLEKIKNLYDSHFQWAPEISHFVRNFGAGNVKAQDVPTFEELTQKEFVGARIKFSFAIGEKKPDISIIGQQASSSQPQASSSEEINNSTSSEETASFWGRVKNLFSILTNKINQITDVLVNKLVLIASAEEGTTTEGISDKPQETSAETTTSEVITTETATTGEETPPQSSTSSDDTGQATTEATATETIIENENTEQSATSETATATDTEATITEATTEATNTEVMIPEAAISTETTATTTIESTTADILQNPDAKIIVWYSLDGQSWQILDTISADNLSNALNEGYFSYDAPFLKSWDDVKNLKIKFEGVVGGETKFTAFLDSVWVEADWQEKEQEEDFELVADKKDWRADETPTFHVMPKGQSQKENIIGKLANNVSLFLGLSEEPKVDATLIGPNNEESPLRKEEDFSAETHSPTVITIFKQEDFRPGLHKLKVNYEKDGKVYTLEQEFTWGVLAINTNKSIYLPDEKAYLQMGVLDEGGRTICDAKVSLEITDPEGNKTILETSDLGETNNKQATPQQFSTSSDNAEQVSVEGTTTEETASTTTVNTATENSNSTTTEITTTTIENIDTNGTTTKEETSSTTTAEELITEENLQQATTSQPSENSTGTEQTSNPAPEQVLDGTGQQEEIASTTDEQQETATSTVSFWDKIKKPFAISSVKAAEEEIPSTSSSVVSTGIIEKSGECGPNTVTYTPDYYAHYDVKGKGTYQIKLTAVTRNGTHEITDSFEVLESVPFDVERIGPTRIYPPSEYKMTLKIKVNEDFPGQITEKVPDSFVVTGTSDNGQETSDGGKQIIWDADWKAGEEYELSYQFDAPDISPYLYLLGPLTFGDKKQEIIFQEARQWQISADSLDPGSSQFMMSIGPVNGSSTVNYVYASFLNPLGSGKIAVVKRIAIRNSNTGSTSTWPALSIRRIEAASNGTVISASYIPKKNTYSANSIMDIRYSTSTASAAVTFDSSATSVLMAALAPVAGAVYGNKEIVFGDNENLILQQGQGIALYQPTTGGHNYQRINLVVEWSEQTTTVASRGEYLLAFPLVRLTVSTTSALNFAYQTFFNPLTSGKTAIIKRVGIDVDASTTAVYQSITLRRIKSVSGGNLIATSDVPQKNTTSASSSMDLRFSTTAATSSVTFDGTDQGRLMTVTGPGAANQPNGHLEYAFGTNDEDLILQPGQGIALYSESTSSIAQMVRLSVEWAETTTAPASAGEYMLTFPAVTVTVSTSSAASFAYQTFFNPLTSGKTALIKRVGIMVDAKTTSLYQGISLRRIKAVSGGNLIATSNVPQKNTTSASSSMDLRYSMTYATASVTFDVPADPNSRILSVTAPSAVAQLIGQNTISFGDNEKFVLQPGQGIALYSEGTSSINQAVKLFVEWAETSTAPVSQGDYLMALGPMAGVTNSSTVYASFFNPSGSGKTAVIERLAIRVDTQAGALYVPFSLGYISAASAGRLIATTSVPQKNTTSASSSMEIRYSLASATTNVDLGRDKVFKNHQRCKPGSSGSGNRPPSFRLSGIDFQK